MRISAYGGEPDCTVARAKAWPLLMIFTANGTIYWPIADTTPSASQNDKLLPFAGQKVTASGKVFERGGSHAFVIEKIEPLPEANEHRDPTNQFSRGAWQPCATADTRNVPLGSCCFERGCPTDHGQYSWDDFRFQRSGCANGNCRGQNKRRPG